MSKQILSGWICLGDFVQIYAPDFGWEVERRFYIYWQIEKFNWTLDHRKSNSTWVICEIKNENLDNH